MRIDIFKNKMVLSYKILRKELIVKINQFYWLIGVFLRENEFVSLFVL